MLASLQWAIWLRVIGAAVFPLAVILAAILERSLLTVVLIAGTMTLGRWLVLRRSLAEEAGSARKLLAVFASRLIPSAILFIAIVGLAALFRETSLAREITMIDLALALVPFALSIPLNWVLSRAVETQRETVETLINPSKGPFRRDTGPKSGEGPIIEGEFERVDDDDPKDGGGHHAN